MDESWDTPWSLYGGMEWDSESDDSSSKEMDLAPNPLSAPGDGIEGDGVATSTPSSTRGQESLVDTAASSRTIEELIASLPQELKGEILDLTLPASIPSKSHLQWDHLRQAYVTSSTEEFRQTQSAFVYRHRPNAHSARFNDMQPGIYRFIDIDAFDTMKRTLVFKKDAKLDNVIPLFTSHQYKTPLALQLNSESRAFWEKEFYGNTVFWVPARAVPAFNSWIRKMDVRQRDKMTFFLGVEG
ncbi:uncharacterized protein RCC_09880 [Ramularia collo-cygni]|uniref:Uncharacterized protein n=1 Tax=Ramularia collo-cygni TaxID=112498 RepID=A0A2D3V834_9PEZI|nr:uncharacterized protein RCC_09880 [Ramularia collo-cygni]CZT24163.1 uncharacterized protein RCC_09880 [Ramularia collo-cygni]